MTVPTGPLLAPSLCPRHCPASNIGECVGEDEGILFVGGVPLGKRPLIRPATAGENACRGPPSPISGVRWPHRVLKSDSPRRRKTEFFGARHGVPLRPGRFGPTRLGAHEGRPSVPPWYFPTGRKFVRRTDTNIPWGGEIVPTHLASSRYRAGCLQEHGCVEISPRLL